MSTAIPLQFIHVVFHEHHDHDHDHEHYNNHHVDSDCSDEDPCHLSLFHSAENSEKACSHEAHYTESETACCTCSNYSFSVIKYLTNTIENEVKIASKSAHEEHYNFYFAGNYHKHCSDRGPPAFPNSL